MEPGKLPVDGAIQPKTPRAATDVVRIITIMEELVQLNGRGK